MLEAVTVVPVTVIVIVAAVLIWDLPPHLKCGALKALYPTVDML